MGPSPPPSDVTVPQVKIPKRYPPGAMGLDRKTGLPTLLLSFFLMSHARAGGIGCKRPMYLPSFDPWDWRGWLLGPGPFRSVSVSVEEAGNNGWGGALPVVHRALISKTQISSDGINRVLSRAQNNDPLPPWRLLLFPSLGITWTSIYSAFRSEPWPNSLQLGRLRGMHIE